MTVKEIACLRGTLFKRRATQTKNKIEKERMLVVLGFAYADLSVFARTTLYWRMVNVEGVYHFNNLF